MVYAGGEAYGDIREDGSGCWAAPIAPGRRGRVEGRKTRDEPSKVSAGDGREREQSNEIS